MFDSSDHESIRGIRRTGTVQSGFSGSSQSSQSIIDTWSISDRDSKRSSDVVPSESPSQTYAREHTTSSEEDCWKRQVVLSLDGGGVRGYASLLILKRLMEVVARVESDFRGAQSQSSADIPRRKRNVDGESDVESQELPQADNFLPCHYFDYVCGTSTGGLIAIMLGRLRCSVDEAINIYKIMWDGIGKEIPYMDRVIRGNAGKKACSSGLGCALDDILKDQQKLRCIETRKGHPDDVVKFQSSPGICKTLVLAVEYDSFRPVRRPYLFRSYPIKASRKTSNLNRNIGEDSSDITIKDVCLATSASPDLFKGHRIGKKKFRDGSIWMSNPSMELFREIDSIYAETESPLYCFASIGSGKQRKGIAERTLRPFSPSFMKRKSVYEREQEMVDQVLQKRNAEGQNFWYSRLDGPTDLPDVSPSDCKSSNHTRIIERIEKCTQNYCSTKAVRMQIEDLADKLIEYRQRRARTQFWGTYVDMAVTETSRHTCKWCSECKDADRDAFIDHVRRTHADKIQNTRRLDDYQGILKDTQRPTVVTIRV